MTQRQKKFNTFSAEVKNCLSHHQQNEEEEEEKAQPHMLPIGPKEDAMIAESSKNEAIFKPRNLQHEASVNEFRQWQNRLQAYYDRSNVADKGPAQHCAILVTCIGDILADVSKPKKTENKDTYTKIHTHPHASPRRIF